MFAGQTSNHRARKRYTIDRSTVSSFHGIRCPRNIEKSSQRKTYVERCGGEILSKVEFEQIFEEIRNFEFKNFED